MTLHGYEGSPVQRQFEAAMSRRGLVPPHKLIADGKLHRCNTKVKNGRGDGSYLLHLDGTIPAGGFQNFQDGLGWENWSFNPGRELTTAERDELRRKSEAAAKARAEAPARDQAKAAEKARRLWDSAFSADRPQSHVYLERKNIQPHGARLKYGSLLIPLFDENGAMVNLQFIRPDGSKTFLKGGRVKGCSYRIPGGDPALIRISEGFATAASIHDAAGATVIVGFNAGNLKPVAEAVRKQSPEADIVIAADDDWKTKGNPGLTKATEAARTIGAKLALPDFGVNRRDRDTDFNDLMSFIGIDAVKRCIDAAAVPEPAPEEIDVEAEIARLAKLGGVEYEREREKAAKRLGMRVGALDAAVEKQRSKTSRDNSDPAHWSVEPWPEAVDGAALLDEIAKVFKRYVILPRCGADALALWVLHAWAFDAADVSPFAVLTSPEKRCGKTTVLIILQYLTPRSELAGNISAAAIFRYIEQRQPTMLIDEGDTFVNGADEIRGILNSGHTKTSAYVIRTVEMDGDHVAKRFSVWAPKAIASIGKIADTLADRSITIIMQRRTRDQKVERLRRRDNAEFARLRSMALRWAQDNTQTLIDADAKDAIRVPTELNDRAADNWRPLVAIGDAAGGNWPDKARAAALALSGVETVDSIGVQLLRDIREALQRHDEQGNIILELEEIKTEDLLAHLIADPERPWADYRRGKALSAKQLGALLGRFGITSEKVQGVRGYKQVRFNDAWGRYLPPDFSPNAGSDPGTDPYTPQDPISEASKRPKANEMGTSSTFSIRPEEGLGRIENSEEVPAAQRFGTHGRFENPGRPGSMKVDDDGLSTMAEMGQGANVAGAASDGADSVTPHHHDRPQCVRCGDSSGTLKLYPVRMPDGIERSAMLHPECWHALAKRAQKKAAGAAASGGGMA